MCSLNFSTFAKAIKKGVAKPTHISITKLLLGLIVNHEKVFNTIGEPYDINGYYTNRWWKQHEDIPGPIKKAAASTEIFSKATFYFENEVIPKLSPHKEADTYSTLRDLIKCDTDISKDKQEQLLTFHKNNDLSEFLAETFLYAIQKNNKISNLPESAEVENDESLKESVIELENLLRRFPKPNKLLLPEDIQTHEMIYISELLSAYSECEGVKIIYKDTLDSYPNYKKNFDRQRKDYYAAETVRQSARDTLALNKTNEFDVLKEEAYDGIIDVCENKFSDGYERLNSVMTHATTIQLNKSILSKLPGWISSSEKKGICHLLVNDGKITWVSDNE